MLLETGGRMKASIHRKQLYFDNAECEEVLAKSLARVEAEEKKAVHLKAGVSSVEFNKLGKVFEFLGLKEE
jgi:hypothetical protein